MFKKIIGLCFILLLSSYLSAQNTGYICSNCGTFDLSKITFNENIDELVSKADPFKTAFANASCEEKRIDEVGEKDQICGFKYSIYKKETDPSFLSFSDQFKFDNLYLLTSTEKSMVAYTATSDFKGDEKAFLSLVNLVSQKFNTKPEQHTLFLDGSLVYQWNTPSYTCQITRSKDKHQRESTVNGKTKTNDFYSLTLGIYQKNKLDAKMKEVIRRNESFVIYTDKNFGK